MIFEKGGGKAMSSSDDERNGLERLLALQTRFIERIVDRKLDPGKFADHLQFVSDNPELFVPGQFALLVDLGFITVPSDYVHRKRLTTFRAACQDVGVGEKKLFSSYDDTLTDRNFRRPTRILKPGQRLHVCAFQQIVPGITTSEERRAHLVAQKMAVYPGPQGLSLVFDQKRDQLPKGKWYASLDDEKRLWKDSRGHYYEPLIGVDAGGSFEFCLSIDFGWNMNHAFLGFQDVK